MNKVFVGALLALLLFSAVWIAHLYQRQAVSDERIAGARLEVENAERDRIEQRQRADEAERHTAEVERATGEEKARLAVENERLSTVIQAERSARTELEQRMSEQVAAAPAETDEELASHIGAGITPDGVFQLTRPAAQNARIAFIESALLGAQLAHAKNEIALLEERIVGYRTMADSDAKLIQALKDEILEKDRLVVRANEYSLKLETHLKLVEEALRRRKRSRFIPGPVIGYGGGSGPDGSSHGVIYGIGWKL